VRLLHAHPDVRRRWCQCQTRCGLQPLARVCRVQVAPPVSALVPSIPCRRSP
jgi:hypothetical protein